MALIYVGCALTDAPFDFKLDVSNLQEMLRERGHQVAEFVTDINPEPGHIFKTDILTNVALCDVFLAMPDFSSTGLGMEMGFALGKYHKPTLAVVREGRKISRLVEDIEYHFPPTMYRFRRYQSLDWVVEVLLPDFIEAQPTSTNRITLCLDHPV